MVSTVNESWATNPMVKPPSLTWQSLTVPDDHDDNPGGESSQPWHSSAQGSKQGSQKQPHSQQPFHASNTSSFQGSLSLMMNYNTNSNDVDNNYASQSSQQPRPGRRGSLVLKNLKNMLRTTSNKSDKDDNDPPKGSEHEEAATIAAAAVEDEKPSLSMDYPERPPLSPRKKTLKERFTIRRPSMLPSPQFNPDEPYPHLDQILPEIVDGMDSGSSPAVAAVPAGVGVVHSMLGNTGSATGSLEDITPATTLTTPPPELAPVSPAKKKKKKLLRPFMSSLPRRSESFPIRPSQQKEKMARRQARQDILGRIGGALGEPVPLNRSGTSSGDSGAFLVDAVDGTSGELVLATTTTPLANHHTTTTGTTTTTTTTTTNHHDSLVLDASERTTGSSNGGRFARVRAMVKRTSIFQGRSKTDTAPLVMLDDPSSEFSMELQRDAAAAGGGEDESSHHDDLEEEDENERDIPKPPELPRPSLENQQANQLPYPPKYHPESMQEEDDRVDGMPVQEPSSDPKVEHSITERRRVRRQHQHRPSSTSPAPNNTSQGHSDVTNKNSPRRGRIGGRRQSRSHPDEEHNKSETRHQSPSSLHRRLRPRNSRSNPTHDNHTSEQQQQHQRRMSKDEPQTPSRRRTRKVVDTKSSNPRSDETDRTKDENDEDVVAAALDDSSVGDPQTPTRRRLRRHDHNATATTTTNNNNSTTPTTSSKSKSTKERENDQQDRKNPSLGDSESSARRNSPDPLTVRRRLKQQSSTGSRNNHPDDDPHTGSNNNNNNNKSSSKHAGSRDHTGSRRSENSPTRNRDHNTRRSLSPPKPGEQPDSDRSSKPPSRERSKEGRSRQRRKSPIKQVGSSQASQSESQDRREKRSTSPQKDDRRSKSPVPKDKGQSRNETIPSSSSPNNDDQATQTAPERSQENGVETSRSRQRSGSPGRSHGRSPTNLKETEASSSRAKGSHRRGRSRDKTIPQRHTSEIEHRSEAMTNEPGSERRRKTKSLSPNSSGDHGGSRRRENDRGELKQQQERSRPSPSSIPENPTPQQPTRVNSYDPSRHRQGSDDQLVISAAVDQNYHKGHSDPSRGRRPQNHHNRRSHHPDDRSVASAGVRRHVGRHPQVETVSELAAKLDALQRS